MTRSDIAEALVQTWAKGFRVSERSQEFQLVVPSDPATLEPTERTLANIDWGEVLQPLYGLRPAELGREFALVLSDVDPAATLAAASHSEDKGGRKSIVVVAATVELDWSGELAGRIGAAWGLSHRLSGLYGGVLRGASPEIEKQLREDRFLSRRAFGLSEEDIESSVGWNAIAREMKRWKGVKGIATRNLLTVGANVIYGTRDEAERNRSKSLDGYFDVARGAIVPLTSNLALWSEKAVDAAEPATYPSEGDPFREINGKLDRIAEQQNQTHSLVEALFEAARSFWFGSRRDDEKRRKK